MSYHIEEVAHRPACWKDIQYFRRVEKMEQIEAFLTKLSNASYRRIFRIYHRHDAAKEAILEVETKKGQILSMKFVGDQRKKHEIEQDQAQWDRRHRTRQYGRNNADMSQWVKSSAKTIAENVQNQVKNILPGDHQSSERILARQFGLTK